MKMFFFAHRCTLRGEAYILNRQMAATKVPLVYNLKKLHYYWFVDCRVLC